MRPYSLGRASLKAAETQLQKGILFLFGFVASSIPLISFGCVVFWRLI
jgi:hypothetical protein